MTDFASKYTENIGSLTIGSESFTGVLDYSIQPPSSPVVFEADSADNPQDIYLDGGVYIVSVTVQRLSPMSAGNGILGLRGTDLSTFTLVVSTRTSGTKTLSLVSGAKCKIGPYRKRAPHGQPSTEEFQVACWHASGVKPIQEVFA